jgi:hypothetical protein
MPSNLTRRHRVDQNQCAATSISYRKLTPVAGTFPNKGRPTHAGASSVPCRCAATFAHRYRSAPWSPRTRSRAVAQRAFAAQLRSTEHGMTSVSRLPQLGRNPITDGAAMRLLSDAKPHARGATIERPDMYKHILIATDGSALATKAMAAGLMLAKKLGSRVTVVTATEPWTAMMTRSKRSDFRSVRTRRQPPRPPVGFSRTLPSSRATAVLRVPRCTPRISIRPRASSTPRRRLVAI